MVGFDFDILPFLGFFYVHFIFLFPKIRAHLFSIPIVATNNEFNSLPLFPPFLFPGPFISPIFFFLRKSLVEENEK